MSAAVNNFLSNDQGVQPGGAAGVDWTLAKDCGTILHDAGNLNQYNAANSFVCPTVGAYTTSGTLNTFDVTSGIQTLTVKTGQSMVLDEGATCPATIGTTALTQTGNNNQDALLYTTEPQAGNWTWTCIQSE